MKGELFNTQRFHEYTTTNKICDFGTFNCTLENVKVDFGLNSWPGANGLSRAQDGAYRFAADGIYIGGVVRQEVGDSGLTVTNHTTGAHFLHQGSITRNLYAGSDGIYVSTIGQGWGRFQESNITVGTAIFNRLDRQVRQAFCGRNGGC